MEITDFSKGQLWGILPESYDAIARAVQDIGKNTELAVEAARFSDRDRNRKAYTVKDGVAVISITGPISKRYSFISWLMNGSSVGWIEHTFMEAQEDPKVEAIVLNIDSPGGTVSGMETLSGTIYEGCKQKPVVAYANGLMASAAYWVGSAARKIVAESTAQVGSIGVMMVHSDYSEEDRKYGVKRTILTAGKYKAFGNDMEPLSREAREYLEGHLDYFYSLFVDTVARNRGVSVETVLGNMADGKIFIGEQAKVAGLVDKIGNLDTAKEMALSLTDQRHRRSISMSGKKELEIEGVTIIGTVAALGAAYPDLVTQIREEAQAQGVASIDQDKLKTDSANMERDRILGLVAIQFGAEAGDKFRAIVEAGVTVEQFEAIRAVEPPAEGISAEDKKQAEMLAAIQGAGADNPGAGGELGASTQGKTFDDEVMRLMKDENLSRANAVRKIVAENPDLHKAYLAGLPRTQGPIQ